MFFSLVQWLDCRVRSKTIAKEKRSARFFVSRDTFSGVCRNCLLSCFLLCTRMPQKAQSEKQKKTYVSNVRKCVCWHMFFNMCLCKNCACISRVHRPLISDLYCVIVESKENSNSNCVQCCIGVERLAYKWIYMDCLIKQKNSGCCRDGPISGGLTVTVTDLDSYMYMTLQYW